MVSYGYRRYFVLAALISGGLTSAVPAADKPNVLFLFTDDQRADTIAALGNPIIKTPNLDRLARTGFVFENAYCMGSTSGAVCNPSRHMTLSGRSLFRYDPKKKEGTFGDVMRRAGYETYHQSKRGNTAQVYHTAFEHSSYLQDGQERTSGNHGRTAADYAIAFFKDTWQKERPFFMYVGFAGPHDPRVAAKEWMDLYDRQQIPLPKNYLPLHPFDNGEMLVRDEKLAPWPRTKDVVRRHLHDYYGCISSIDHNIGRIFQTLKAMGQFENTIVVFASDHGLAVGSHGLFGKQNLYEHSMNSPLIFAGPGIPKGKSEALAYLFDIFPTVADLVEASMPNNLDGRSLAPIIRGKNDAVRDTVFLAYKNVQRAVRRGNWKLIRYPLVDRTQLFHLEEDPHELKNLADSAEHADKVQEMLELLAQQQKQYDDKAPLTIVNPKPDHIDLEFFGK